MDNPLDSLPPPTASPLDTLAPPVQQAAPLGYEDWLKAAGSALVRPIAKAAASLPLMAADAGVAIGNFASGRLDWTGHPIPGENAYPLPSTTFDQALDSVTQKPTGIGRVGELASTVLLGSRIPMTMGEGTPNGFSDAREALKTGSLQAAQKAGYVVAPSSNNPTFANRLLEGIGGKLKLQQEASAVNQGVTQRLGAESLGQNAAAPLTQDALQSIRTNAYQTGYEPVRAAGQITATPQLSAALSAITQASQGAGRSFAGLAGNPQLEGDIKALNQPTFDAGDAIDAIKILRSKASDAFSAGQGSVGQAYRQASAALEDQLEAHLSAAGQNSLLAGYVKARQLIAQTYTIGKSVVDDLGTISARKIGSQLAGGAPLVDQQKAIGSFALNFPKVNQVITDSAPSISPLDAYGSAIAAGAAHSVAPLALPLTRVGIRGYLLSQAGQAGAIPEQTGTQTTLGGLGSLATLSQQIASYLSN